MQEVCGRVHLVPDPAPERSPCTSFLPQRDMITKQQLALALNARHATERSSAVASLALIGASV